MDAGCGVRSYVEDMSDFAGEMAGGASGWQLDNLKEKLSALCLYFDL